MSNLKIITICISIITLVGCQEDSALPVAKIKAFPSVGDTCTFFTFDASESTDDRFSTESLQVRWFIEGQMSMETNSTLIKSYTCRLRKKGQYLIIAEVTNGLGFTSRDSIQVLVKDFFKDSVFYDSRDNHAYKTGYIDGLWVMSENLVFGRTLNVEDLPTRDGIAEYYNHPSISTYGGYYTIGEAMNYGNDTIKGICPDGWHLPRIDEVKYLLQRIYLRQNMEFYFGMNGYLNVDFDHFGQYYYPTNDWGCLGRSADFWMKQSYSESDFKIYRFMTYEEGLLGIQSWAKRFDSTIYHFCQDINYRIDLFKMAIPIRCFKDE